MPGKWHQEIGRSARHYAEGDGFGGGGEGEEAEPLAQRAGLRRSLKSGRDPWGPRGPLRYRY
jgi:hypothetical protein